MKKLLIAFTAIALLGSVADAKGPCRDAKGKFAKCPVATATVAPAVTKDKNGRCHVASGPKKGQFTKCP